MKDGSIQKWTLWPAQEQLAREWMSGESTVAVKARQLGITTESGHFALWEVLFKDAARWHAISQNESSAKDLMTRLRATIDRLPTWMLERAGNNDLQNAPSETTSRRRRSRKAGSDAVTRFSCGLSELVILTSTPESVQGKAGKFILDEFSKHKQQKRIYQLLLPAFDGGGQAIIIANGNGEDIFYHICQSAKRGESQFRFHFFSWKDDPTRDEAWYEHTRAQYLLDNPEADEFSFKAQFPSTEDEAFFITGNSRFKLGVINEIAKRIRAENKPMIRGFIEQDNAGINGYRLEPHGQGKLRVWAEPEPEAEYIIGVDSAGGAIGGKGDYGVVQVGRLYRSVKPETENVILEQVAEYQARVEPTYLSIVAEKLGRWYNDAFIVVEKNNHGGTVLARLKTSYLNLYQNKRDDYITDEDRDSYGYLQTPRAKAEMIDSLAEWLYADSLHIHSSVAVTELARYEVKENGSTGAPQGFHDDLVVGLGLIVIGARDRLTAKQADPIEIDPWRDW